MEIPPLLLQFAGSLLAIFALAGLAWWLNLGGKPILADEDAVRRAASEVVDGFDTTRVSLSRSKTEALAADSTGHIILIKRHGNQFAGRLLDRSASVQEAVDSITVDPGDARFGVVRLQLSDPGYWADRINRL